jgi:hypothetical protein
MYGKTVSYTAADETLRKIRQLEARIAHFGRELARRSLEAGFFESDFLGG